MFVSLEGIDRSGKTTQARLLADAMGAETLLVREPGGTPAGERIRELVKDPSTALGPMSELLLFCAARAELVSSVIRPALEAGRSVVCDRFTDSSLAYQGIVRGLGTETVKALNAAATGGLLPERTVFVRVEAETAWERAGQDGRERERPDRDRFEAEGLEFQRRLATAYEQIAAGEPDRFLVIDGSGPADEVHSAIRAALGV